MKKTAATQLAVSTLLMSLLAACGGGGGGGSSGSASTGSGATAASSGTQQASTNTVVANSGATLVAAAATSIAAYTATGNVDTDSLGYLNAIRQTLGLRVLTQNAAVAQAALNHADYLVANQASGHNETPGLTDFTGADSQTRIDALHPTTFNGEVTITTQTGIQLPSLYGIETLFDAPFHRIVMLSDFATIGVGSNSAAVSNNTALYSALNIDFADPANALASNQFVAYPFSGQTGAPYQWVANESPNPMNDAPAYMGATVGYPVTLQGGVNDTLAISTFKISSNGVNVPCLEVDPQTASIGSELHGAALCTPYQALSPSTQYTATVAGTRNGAAFSVSWSWTTEAAASQKQAVGMGGLIDKLTVQ
ncbi:CAP domain-containing protein [Paraburkholderia acidisoli]|uniref:CAP domain-containing protein n=1 Tax=Paraburkholderia acidisoli TaxID=2571748 RepID=A0A7Z2GI72_9BURK|nr:CAP domain-containing protein [Paraburkholderia acidisoli]QGZ62277.1 CAP domain-containing protein [Paraburkholderia acidisoli]